MDEELKKALKEYQSEIQKKNEEMKKNLDGANEGLKNEIKEIEKKRDAMQKQLDAIELEAKKKAKIVGNEKGKMTFEKGVRELLNSEEFKEAKKDKFTKKSLFQVKASTSDITGVVNLTPQKYELSFTPERALGFLPYLNAGTVGADKNRIPWMDGTYTSNVGYVGEGTGAATADAGTAVEKSRALAKISAKLPLTAELLEDASYIASAFRMKMREKADLFTDKEFYTGNGDDSTNPNHIYGIVSQATAFNATTAGVAASVVDPNIGDLIDACICQAQKTEQNGLNIVWMNPSDFFKLRTAKNSTGDRIFIKDVNGGYTISGLKVIVNSAVTAGTLTVADSTKIQAWWKRYPEIKFGQAGDDLINDTYIAVLFLRCQCLVETYDKTAIIHVADISAALTALTAV